MRYARVSTVWSIGNRCVPSKPMVVINDLTCQNAALLTKWIWAIVNKPDGLWASTVAKLYGATANNILGEASSFFMKDLADLMPFFNSSIRQGDENKWRWTESGAFTCASAYKMMHNTVPV